MATSWRNSARYSPGLSTPVAAPSRSAPILLDDKPLKDIEEPSPFRQSQLRDQLLAYVDRYLENRHRPGPVPVIALLGRYGQGKSTIVRAICAKVQQSNRLWVSHCRVHMLDVARYKPDDIQSSAEALLAPWVTLRQFASMLLLLLAVLAATAYVLWPGTIAGAASPPGRVDLKPWLPFILIPVTAGAALIASALGLGLLSQSIALLAAELHGSLSPGRWRRAGRLCFEHPLIIVDNLDRVTVDQQKALLRAIHRVRGNLRSMIVVAMDQTRLIESSPDPESPPELLRKVFDLQLQMPPMTVLDAQAITERVFEEARTLNDPARDTGLRWVHVLLDSPLVLGDFGRIVFLHRRHSQRFPRRVLNNALAAAHTIDVQTPLAFAALLRLHGLFEYLPSLQHDPVAIASLMRADDGPALVAHAARHLGKPVPPEIDEAVCRYIVATRHIHPDFADWQAFTGRFGHAEPGQAEPGSVNQQLDAARWAPWSSDEVAALGQEWLTIDLKLAEQEDDAVQRLVQIEEAEKAAETVSATIPPGGMIARRFLLHRLWLADDAVHRHMLATRCKRLLHLQEDKTFISGWRQPQLETPAGQNIGPTDILQAFLRLLPNTPADSHTQAQAALFAASTEIGRRPATDAVRRWLASARPEVPSETDLVLRVFDNFYLTPTNSAPLAVAWPQAAADAPRDWAALRHQVQIARLLKLSDCDVPIDAVSRAIASVSWEAKAADVDLKLFLEVWASTCPPFIGNSFGSWDERLIASLWDRAWDLAFAEHATEAFAAFVCGAFSKWKHSRNFAAFYIILIVQDRLDGSSPGLLQHRLRQILADLADGLAPGSAGWDQGFLEGLCRLKCLTSTGAVGPDFRRLRATLRKEAERLQDSVDGVVQELGHRLGEQLQ